MSEESAEIAESVVVNDRGVREVAIEILDWLGWPTPGKPERR
jgi:hypothetical protein